MRYFLIVLLFFIGCNQKKDKKIYIEDIIDTNISTTNPKIIKIENLKFYEKNNTITYNFERAKILVFIDNSNFSKLQLKELNKTSKKFYIIKNNKLENYFKIVKYPTILIIDNNSTKKYEGFIPYEILKYELKD